MIATVGLRGILYQSNADAARAARRCTDVLGRRVVSPASNPRLAIGGG